MDWRARFLSIPLVEICCSVLMSTEERGCSVLLCEVVNHWQTDHTPSKGDGYASVRRFDVIYQYNTRLGTAVEWRNVLTIKVP